jgi:hypothetical protein
MSLIDKIKNLRIRDKIIAALVAMQITTLGGTFAHLHHEITLHEQEVKAEEEAHSYGVCYGASRYPKNKVLNTYKFKDTEKPNAVVMLPKDDYNGAFTNGCFISLRQKINNNYDAKFVIAETEDELYKALEEVPDQELRVFFGHGTKTSLRLSNDKPLEFPSEKRELGIWDTEISNYNHNAKPNCRTVLISCSNGAGREEGDNLANFIAKQTGQEVFAGSKSFNKVKVRNVSPLEVGIISIEDDKESEVTYVAKPN